MDKIRLTDNRWVGKGEKPFIIAEIGNNHNGDIEIAKKLIKTAKKIGVDAVKFQKKDVETAFPKELLDSPYMGPNSFGVTYREHKMALELSEEEFHELKAFADKLKIIFFATPFDLKSVDILEKVGIPFYKISSFHVTNLKLIEYVCNKNRPILMSTGMSSIEEIDKAVELIRKYSENFALFHCVSSYPTDPENLNLRVIKTLKKRYKCPIGYSGHERGARISPATIMLGACMIERHLTLDRTMKGTDHVLSVEPYGMSLIVRRTQEFFIALGSSKKRVLECELPARKKNRGY